MKEKYSLLGLNGNVFVILGYTRKAMRECGYSNDDINLYLSDAQSSDYNHALAVSLKMIEECNKKVGGKL